MMHKVVKACRSEAALLYLMLILSLLVMTAVYIHSGKSDLARLKDEMKDTADYVHTEYAMTKKFNQVTVMQSLETNCIMSSGRLQENVYPRRTC